MPAWALGNPDLVGMNQRQHRVDRGEDELADELALAPVRPSLCFLRTFAKSSMKPEQAHRQHREQHQRRGPATAPLPSVTEPVQCRRPPAEHHRQRRLTTPPMRRRAALDQMRLRPVLTDVLSGQLQLDAPDWISNAACPRSSPRSDTRMPMMSAITSDLPRFRQLVVGTTPIPSAVRPTLRQGAQARTRPDPFEQHHRALMVGPARARVTKRVGLIGVVPPNAPSGGSPSLSSRRLPPRHRHGGSQRVEMPRRKSLPTVDDARPHAPARPRISPTPSCSADARHRPSSSMAPRTAIRNGCCSDRHAERDRPSSPAFMESGLALNESSISVNDVSGFGDGGHRHAMRADARHVGQAGGHSRQSACPTSSPPWLRQARS